MIFGTYGCRSKHRYVGRIYAGVPSQQHLSDLLLLPAENTEYTLHQVNQQQQDNYRMGKMGCYAFLAIRICTFGGVSIVVGYLLLR